MNRTLDDFLLLAGRLDATLTADDIASWPRAVSEFAKKNTLLRGAPNARHLVCDQCGSGHVEQIGEMMIEGGSTRYFIFCPDAGRVFVEPSRLMQWTIDGARLASIFQAALGAEGEVETLVDDRIWRLGTLLISNRILSPVIVRGVYMPNADEILSAAMSRLAADKVLLIILGDDGKRIPAAIKVAAIIPAHPTFSLRGDRLRVDLARIETSVPEISGHGDGPLIDDGAMSVTYRGKSCRFNTRASAQFALLKRLSHRPGHRVSFDTLRDEGEVFGEYPCEDSTIRSAVSRLRERFEASGMKRLANCLMTGKVEGRGYAVMDLSRYDTNAH